MKYYRHFLILTIFLILPALCFGVEVNVEALVGEWEEKSGNKKYSFQINHDFEYGTTNSDNGNTQKGAWKYKPATCSIGDVKGNLMIFLGTKRCCFQANYLGDNLILMTLKKPRYGGVCDDRVLIKVNERRK